ncbi:MAG: C-GCAxxG-C-C family protein [Marinilabiliales bacterium]|nr:C-GCAxxG-C-C family protein [Marinilabiliales bacterium]
MKEVRTNRALEAFASGCNCAQSVVMAYAEEFGLTTGQAKAVSVGFGGGMGRLQQTCGAVTGAYMIIGLWQSSLSNDSASTKDNTYSFVRDFDHHFRQLHQSTQCIDLLNCNIATVEGHQKAKELQLFDKICTHCISDSIFILSQMMEGKQEDILIQ